MPQYFTVRLTPAELDALLLAGQTAQTAIISASQSIRDQVAAQSAAASGGDSNGPTEPALSDPTKPTYLGTNNPDNAAYEAVEAPQQ